MNNFVRDEVTFGYNASDDLPASRVLADHIGQCNTKGTLLMALLRAVGVACRFHRFTIDKALQKGAITGGGLSPCAAQHHPQLGRDMECWPVDSPRRLYSGSHIFEGLATAICPPSRPILWVWRCYTEPAKTTGRLGRQGHVYPEGRSTTTSGCSTPPTIFTPSMVST